MKIVFVSTKHNYNDTRVLLKEAATLSSIGHQVYHVAPGDSNKRFREHGVNIQLYISRKSILRKLIKFTDLYKIINKIKPDVLHCNEVDSWFFGCFYKMLHSKVRVIFDVHEHYPSRFDESHVSWMVRVFGKPFFKPSITFFSKYTDYFIFAKRSVASDYPKKIPQEYIFNYSQTSYSDRKYSDVSEDIKKLYKGSLVAVHIGGFSKNRGWPQALRALSLMKNCDLKLHCIGTIFEGVESFMKEAKLLGVDNRVKCFDRINFSEMFDHLLCANIGCMFYQPGILNHTYAFPMKLYDYMLAGIPVVGPEFSIEVEPVINGEKIGYCVDTSDPQSIANALDLLCSETESSKKMGERARDAALTKYNWSNEAIKLKNVYEKIESELYFCKTAT